MSLIIFNAILTIEVEHDCCPLTNHCDAIICIPMQTSTLITNARTTSSDSGRMRIKSPLLFLFIMLCCWILSHWSSIQKESWWAYSPVRLKLFTWKYNKIRWAMWTIIMSNPSFLFLIPHTVNFLSTVLNISDM